MYKMQFFTYFFESFISSKTTRRFECVMHFCNIQNSVHRKNNSFNFSIIFLLFFLRFIFSQYLLVFSVARKIVTFFRFMHRKIILVLDNMKVSILIEELILAGICTNFLELSIIINIHLQRYQI